MNKGEIDIGKLLFNVNFTAAHHHLIKSQITKKNPSFSGNIHVKAELLDKHGSKIK